MLDGIVLSRRQDIPWPLRTASFVGGLAFGLAISCLILLAAGVGFSDIVDDLITQVFFTADGLAQTATQAAPLILVGLSSAAAAKVRFWNIGLEGQVWWGAIAATWIGLDAPAALPGRLPLLLALSAVAGAAWIVLPLWLKLRYRVSEVVLTLLLTNVAFLSVQYLLFGRWKDPATGFPVSPSIDLAARLPQLGWGSVHAGLILAVVLAVLLWVLFDRTRFGFYATAVGLNAETARATGLPVVPTVTLCVLLSGALSGLAGGVIVAGTEYHLTTFIADNYTFSGIVIAFLARFSPLGVIVAAVAVSGMYTAGGSLKVFYSLSEATVVLIEGVILMSLLLARFFSLYRIGMPHWRAAR